MTSARPAPSHRRSLRVVFGMPLAVAALTLFGLLSALLGRGVWLWLSWLALLVPIGLILYYTYMSLRRAGSIAIEQEARLKH